MPANEPWRMSVDGEEFEVSQHDGRQGSYDRGVVRPDGQRAFRSAVAGRVGGVGQRVRVVRCSLREAQLEPVTCTEVLAMAPPQSTQWPLPMT